MKRWIKLIVTIVLAVSIPLQGLATVSMPACNMSKVSMGAGMAMKSVGINMTIDKSIGMNEANVKSTVCDMNFKNCCAPVSSKTCSDQKCSTCYLNVFQLPDTGLLSITDKIAMDYQDLISEPYQTFPPAPFHPPKLLSI